MRSTRSDILIHLDELMFVIHEKRVVNDKSITTSYGKLILMVYGICSYFIDVTYGVVVDLILPWMSNITDLPTPEL